MSDFSKFNAMLSEHREAFEEFRRTAETIFTEHTAGKVYKRKPPVGIRLQSADKSAMLCASPHWWNYRRRQELRCDHVSVELICEVQIRTRDGETGFQLDQVMLASLEPAKLPTVGMFKASYADEAVTTIIEIITAFVADPAAVMRRSSDHCSICGRALTDGTSRARGVGPECIEKVGWLFYLKQPLLDRLCATEA